MNEPRTALNDRLKAVRDRIGAAVQRSGRGPGSVALVGITKFVPAEVVAQVVALGLADVGENRVQEAEGKRSALGESGARWHMVGHLQRNKAARAARLFDRVQSVDGVEVAEALSRHAAEAGRRLPVLIEVNVGEAATQFGVTPGALEKLVEAVAPLPGLALDGLMTVGPRPERAEDARPVFAALRELRGRTERSVGVALPVLSMGMSDDFEVAIEEGSTLVRIGTALFGSRL